MRLLEAPLIDDLRATFDADAIQLVVTLPAKVRCISTPAVIAHEDITRGEEREEAEEHKAEEHDVKDRSGLWSIYTCREESSLRNRGYLDRLV